ESSRANANLLSRQMRWRCHVVSRHPWVKVSLAPRVRPERRAPQKRRQIAAGIGAADAHAMLLHCFLICFVVVLVASHGHAQSRTSSARALHVAESDTLLS